MRRLSRREFVAAGIAAGAGLVVGFYLPHAGRSTKEVFSPNAYLRITPDNKITIVVARSEMGQGVRTALPMILAEELEADWKQIEIEQAGASTLYGDQTTGGSARKSSSIRLASESTLRPWSGPPSIGTRPTPCCWSWPPTSTSLKIIFATIPNSAPKAQDITLN